MRTITIPRSGQAPLQFTGNQIWTSNSHDTHGPCRSRWHELFAYDTKDGQFVLAIAFFTKWQGEHNRTHAWVCASLGDLCRRLAEFDPFADLIGFPPGAQFDAKRKHTEKCLRQCWEGAVSELLDEFPEII